MLHILGCFGAYGFFIYYVIGYDKLVHFMSGLALIIALLELLTENNHLVKIGIALLILLGLGSIVEISEFIGSVYFGIDNNGIFSIGDGLSVVSDLQRYDTYT